MATNHGLEADPVPLSFRALWQCRAVSSRVHARQGIGTQPNVMSGTRLCRRRPENSSGNRKGLSGRWEGVQRNRSILTSAAGCQRSTMSRSCSDGHAGRLRMSATVRTVFGMSSFAAAGSTVTGTFPWIPSRQARNRPSRHRPRLQRTRRYALE
jgi:hypothetical protein